MGFFSFLAGIAYSIAAFFRLKASSNRQRREAEADISQEEANLKAKTDEIKAAVYSSNDARLNEILLGLMKPSLLILFSLIFIGCANTKKTVLYIPTDRNIESCTNSIGISCKAVPDVVMVEMLEKLQELKDLKTEMKVERRLSK